jgi:hypothetical protein
MSVELPFRHEDLACEDADGSRVRVSTVTVNERMRSATPWK